MAPRRLEISGPDYVWIVSHTAAINSAASRCADDRIVMDWDGKEHCVGVLDVDRSLADKRVSDHWSVRADFHADRDGGG